MFTNKTPRGGGVQPSKLTKLIKLRKRVLAFALSLITAVSAFAGLDLTAFAAGDYAITINASTNGTVTASVGGSPAATAAEGDTVTLTITPASGYELDALTVKASSAITATIAADKTSATFTMPGEAVTVTPSFKLAPVVYDGSPIDIKITITLNNYPAGTEIKWLSTDITYTYDVYDDFGTLTENQITDNHILFTEESPGVFVGQGNLSHTVSDRDGKNRLTIIYKHTVADSKFTVYSNKEYTDTQINVGCTHGRGVGVPSDDAPAVTPDWDRARIYCFNDPECDGDPNLDSAKPLSGTRYTPDKGAHRDLDLKSVKLYANGGKVDNVVGTNDNTKTKQLTLWETFVGIDAGTYDSTLSKQIAWIVTKDDKCPDNMKQKSDNSVVKVSKGKITAVAPGVAYVWACRVHPDDPTSVSTTESARVRVIVEDAPSKVVLTHEIPDDENATVVPIKKEELGVGEIQRIYIYMESKTEKIDSSQWRIEVTKGSEYLGVSYDGKDDTFSTRTVRPFRGDQHAMFFIKGLGVKPDGKATTAEVTLTNLYTGKKTKLRVNISNAVVETTQPVRGADDLSGLVVTSQRVKMSYALPHKTLNNYYKTSAQKYLVETDKNGNVSIPSKYAAIIDSPTSDKPQIIVTSDTDVTREMIFKDTKSGLQVNFTGTKSKTVTAKWESGFLKMDVKKDAAAEKGNIIIIFNKSHDMNGVLIVPYQVTSADPDNTPAA